MTVVSFKLDDLGPFNGNYKDEGKHVGDVRRLEFETPTGFRSPNTNFTDVTIDHPDGRSISGKIKNASINLSGMSYIEFTPFEG